MADSRAVAAACQGGNGCKGETAAVDKGGIKVGQVLQQPGQQQQDAVCVALGSSMAAVCSRARVAINAHASGQLWWVPLGGPALLRNLVRALLSSVSTTLDFFNMLICMTFNVGLFVGVVMGYVLGAFLFS